MACLRAIGQESFSFLGPFLRRVIPSSIQLNSTNDLPICGFRTLNIDSWAGHATQLLLLFDLDLGEISHFNASLSMTKCSNFVAYP